MIKLRVNRHRGGNQDNLFGWTVFLLLLAIFAGVSWVGSFYIFGHPEKSISYGILRTLGKIDAPKRFELTKAPRGQFLDADKLFERYGKMTPRELEAGNASLLRNYLRNYQRTKELVPYVIGNFNVMGAFRLGPNNFFPDGVVALAQSKENPSVLLELIFPAAEADVGQLERMLRMGLDLQLARTLDLSALINARIMPDGRLNLTAVPLLYGSYTSTDAAGTLNLEPPADLNISAGLPVLNQAAVDEADKRYSAQRKPSGIALRSPTLMRVQRTEAIAESAIPVAAYRENLRTIFKTIQDAGIQLIWATTTPVNEERHHAVKGFDRFEHDVDVYNAAAAEVTSEFGVPVDDLYAMIMRGGRDELIGPDGVHFPPAGSEVLGKTVAAYLRPYLQA